MSHDLHVGGGGGGGGGGVLALVSGLPHFIVNTNLYQMQTEE